MRDNSDLKLNENTGPTLRRSAPVLLDDSKDF